MATTATAPAYAPTESYVGESGVWSWLTTVDHKRIGTLYLFTGEIGDALMLLGFVFVVMGITIVQERRTERALDALRDLSSPRALVIRDGVHRRIAGREVVRGDILLLAEGDRVPADAVLHASAIAQLPWLSGVPPTHAWKPVP